MIHFILHELIVGARIFMKGTGKVAHGHTIQLSAKHREIAARYTSEKSKRDIVCCWYVQLVTLSGLTVLSVLLF